jgi:O-antigen ligase
MALCFYGFLLLILNFIVGFRIYDVSLMPRLLALMVFLAAVLPFFIAPKFSRNLDFRILRDPVVVSFGLYFSLTAVSHLFAINATAGFNDLFKTFGTFVVLCLSCLMLASTPGWPVLLSRIVTLAALGSCGVGFYQITTQFGFGFPTRAEAEAVTGLMSNVNLYAGFLNLLLPFCLCGLFIQRGVWRGACALASVATVFLIVLLQSRAAYISLFAGGAVVCVVLFFFRKTFGLAFSKRALGAMAVGVFLLVAAGVAGFALDIPAAQRLRTIFTSDFSAIDGGRLMIWGITLEMIRDFFWTGVGAGNFTIRMHEYLGQPGQDFSGKITNWAQPHHDFLWVFSEKGLFGFLVFFAVFFFAFWRAFAFLRTARSRDSAWIVLFSIMGLTAYVTASCFDFPLERINQQVYLAVFLSIVIAAGFEGHPSLGSISYQARFAVCTAAILFALFGTAYGIIAIRQEFHVNLARRAIRNADFPAAIFHARQAATTWKTLDPVATPVAFLEGYAFWKSGNTAEALPLLERARVDNPNRLYILSTLGQAYIQSGMNAEALECLSLAIKRYPDDSEARSAWKRALHFRE